MEKKTAASNRKAFHDYEILERVEAGMALAGYEVKSLRKGDANLTDGMVRFWKGEAYLENVHIPPYAQLSTHILDYDARRRRKLLLRRQEIERLETRVREKGLTVVPLEVFFSKRGYAKVILGLAKGRKSYDKREALRRRDMDKDTRRELGARR